MIKIDDFKVGGSQRKYITHTGVLPEIDGDTLSGEQKQKLIEKCYTMCDGYIAQPGETTGEETGKTEGEGTGEPTGEETGKTEGEGTGEPTGEGTGESTGEETGKTEGDENPQDGGVSTLK